MQPDCPPQLLKLLNDGAWVKVTNPHAGSSWTGRLIGYGADPTVVIERADGFRLALPAHFDIERTEPEPKTLGRFDTDPDALAWARGHVQDLIGKFKGFATTARNEHREDDAGQWRRMANILEMELIGGHGCRIGCFDERRPQMPTDPGGPW